MLHSTVSFQPFIMQTDVSGVGLGAELLQDAHGERHVSEPQAPGPRDEVLNGGQGVLGHL